MSATLTMMTQRFDMEFVDKERYNALNHPKTHLGQSHIPPVMVTLKERKLASSS